MASSFLRFIWIAFREYWGVWVTGTGIVGLLLWGLSFIENVVGWKMRPRHYIATLFCTFWFLATFSAWHDADKNLSSVINQRIADGAQLGGCKADLQVQTVRMESWQERFADQQRTINALQGPQLKQQATINSCVTSLGKMNPILTTRIEAYYIELDVKQDLGFYEMLITTNHPETPSGRIHCDGAFQPLTPAYIHVFGLGIVMQLAYQPPRAISDRDYEVQVHNTGASWGPNSPIYFAFRTSDPSHLGKCKFTPQ